MRAGGRSKLIIGLGVVVAVVLLVYLVMLTSADRSVLFAPTTTFEHDGMERGYLVHEPRGEPQGIVVGFHELGGSGRRFAYYSALHNVLDDYIVIYPDAVRATRPGVSPGWNAGFCCGSGWVGAVDDVGLVLPLISEVRTNLGVGALPVHVVGMSNGGMFAHRLAASSPGHFSSVSVVAGSLGTTESAHSPTQPVPLLLIHGRHDTTVPFVGGAGGTDPDFKWLSFAETRDRWVGVNAPAGDLVRTKSAGRVTETFSGRAPLEAVVFDEAGHLWPGARIWQLWRQTPLASRLVAEFIRSNG